MQYNAIDRHEETAQVMIGAFKRENTACGAWITSRVFLTALRMAARLMMAQNAATQASAVSSMASSLAEARNEVIRASDGAARDKDDGCMTGGTDPFLVGQQRTICGRFAVVSTKPNDTTVCMHPS